MISSPSFLAARDVLGVAAVVGWFIWKSRNDFIFNELSSFPEVIAARSSSLLEESLLLEPSPALSSEISDCPLMPYVALCGLAIFCDAAFLASDSAVVGCVVFDSSKRLYDGSAR